MIARLIATVAALAALTLPASGDVITRQSPHDVAQTMDQLVAAVEGAGATVFARVDHAAGAEAIGADLAGNQLLIFGNPRIGTPVMQAEITAGLDLPLRVLVFADGDGATTVAYHDPATLAEEYGVPPDLEALTMMTGALDKLTGAAVAP